MAFGDEEAALISGIDCNNGAQRSIGNEWMELEDYEEMKINLIKTLLTH